MDNWRTTQTGLLIGALAAIALSTCIALLQFITGAPWKELLEIWWKMLVLTIPAFAAATAVIMLTWRERRAIGAGGLVEWPPLLKAEPIVLDSNLAMQEPRDLGCHLSLAEAVAQNAWDQATWHYEYGRNPTRRAFEENGIPQTIWASGREILKEAGLVGEDRKWAEITWEEAQEVLSKIYPEEDRIWLKPLGKRTMVALHISPRAINKKHTSKEADSEYPNL